MPIKHTMKLNAAPFDATKAGLKTIEIRLRDEKRQAIRPGHTLRFEKVGSNEILEVKVVAIRFYKSLMELTQKENFRKTGGLYSDRNEWITAINSYYPIEDQVRYGLLSIEIQL